MGVTDSVDMVDVNLGTEESTDDDSEEDILSGRVRVRVRVRVVVSRGQPGHRRVRGRQRRGHPVS